MSGQKRKKSFCPFSSLKKPKRWKSDGTEEFSVERALHDRGSYYNQDEFAFCPSVFQLFAGSEHSQPHRVRLVARMLVPPQDFSFLASWGTVIMNISGDRRGVMLSIIPILPTKSSAQKKSQQFTYKPFQSSWYFVLSNDHSVITLRRSFVPEL